MVARPELLTLCKNYFLGRHCRTIKNNPVLMLNQLLFSFSLIFPGVRLGADSQFSDFLDGLGPAQLVGRQTLATPAMGKNNMFSYVMSPTSS